MSYHCINKYGVPRHFYAVVTSAFTRIIDVGNEEDWGDIQPCTPDDCKDWKNAIGIGNDADGHARIISVCDGHTGSVWSGKEAVLSWYNQYVAVYAKKYSN